MRLEDEPTIAKDMLEAISADSTNLQDLEQVTSAYRIMNTGLFETSDKIEFLKANEQ